MRTIVATMILAVLAATTTPAGADDRKTAEKHFRTGERLFSAGDFVHAAGSFEAAYATLPLPAIAFSAAQPETRAAIEQTLPILRNLLSEHGLALTQTTVNGGGADPSGNGQPQRGDVVNINT